MGESKQNCSPVYTMPAISADYGQDLEAFLLDESLFPPSYIEKNRQFLSFLEWRQLPFSLDAMVQYIEHKGLKKQTVRPSTIRNRKYQMKRICRELIIANPEKWTTLDEFRLDAFFKRIATGSVQSSSVDRDRVLTPQEVRKLLLSAPLRWRLMFLFLSVTGLRVSEMISVIRLRCKKGPRDVKITVTGKGNKMRTVTCSKALFEQIEAAFPDSRNFLFSTSTGKPFHRSHIWRGARRLGIQILGREIGVHTFRHSLATNLIEKGVELKKVSDFLGHSTSQITMDMYLHLDDMSLEDLPDYGV